MKVNLDTNKATPLLEFRQHVKYMWIVDEDGEYQGKKVQAGDIIINLYGRSYRENHIFIYKQSVKDNQDYEDYEELL